MPTRPSAARGQALPVREVLPEVLAALKRLGNARARAEMGPRFGIRGPTAQTAHGASMTALQELARKLIKARGLDHELALALWETGQYEARALASLIDDPARVTAAQMDAWSKDFDNWGTCDTVCFKLFDKVDPGLAFRKIARWSRSPQEFVKRGGFALLASIALHDKVTADAPFTACLPLMEKAAADERNFVKKGVSWALRAVGRRSGALHRECVALSQRLAACESPSPRWIGRDALRELSSPSVLRLIASKAPAQARRSR